ncbi:MAG: 50S ribosomal protein L24 [Chloroflexi bacterium]|nr:50S ribosomal protein L24 [Chloroflexota bacterium]
MAFGIRRNDQVVITAGRDKGKRGRVLRVEPRKDRLFVEGLNIVTRHLGQQGGQTRGGLTTKEAPLNMSNVKIVCPSCDEKSRIGTRILGDGTKVRICKACNEVLE